MPEYRLYYFKRGHIERAETLAARDDVVAVRTASAIVDNHSAELWRGAARLKILNGAD